MSNFTLLPPRPVRRGRPVLALSSAAALGLALLVLPAGTSAASDPASSALTVPSTPGTVTARYTGTAPAGAFATSECPAGTPLGDDHDLTLTVPAGAYSKVTASIAFKASWTEVSPAGNDLVLTVFDAAGNVVGNSDGGAPEENVALVDLAAGTYTATVCGFANPSPQPYDGLLTVRTTTKAAAGSAGPTVDTGLDFAAGQVTDPQRSQGESAAFADASGVLYSCGTNGASNGTDHGSVSVDGGQTWKPLGTGPVALTGTAQGGGDCAIGTGQDLNAEGKRQLAFIGLGPLTGFSTFSSPDNGRTLQRSPDQNGLEKFNQTSLVDRQWLVFTDDKTVFLNYNAAVASAPGQPDGQIIQKSTDGGLTYGPQLSVATDGSRLGQIRAIKEGVVPGTTKDVVYFPYNSGTKVKLALSLDGGDTWSQCLAVDAKVDPTAGFVTADHDSAGNIYVTYSEKGDGRDTYLVALKAVNVPKCKGPNPTAQSADNNTDPGFTKKVRMNREGVETTVMPWVAAGGAPGRVAVSYYGTPSVGNPDLGDFIATWDVYVSQTLDAFAETPAIDQVKATTHPNHYNSICLNGLGCSTSVPAGDRSLVDYFTMAYDPVTGRLLIVFNQTAKTPSQAEGNIAAPTALVQRAGPSNKGGRLTAGPPVLRTSSPDVKGDAFARWTTSDGLLGSPTTSLPGDNLPALDLLGVKVGPQVDLDTGAPVTQGGGFTVTMTYDDLSDAALQDAMATGGGLSLVYLFRFFDGFQPGGVAAYYEGGAWRFGGNDYTTTTRNPGGNVQTYPGGDAVQGKVDVDAGTITLSVPAEQVEALAGSSGAGKTPSEVPAVKGSRVYDASAWTFVNPLPTSVAQSFLSQVDNSAAFDFTVGSVPAVATPVTGAPPAAAPPAAAPSGGRLPATGGLGAPLLAVSLLGLGWALAVRRRRTV